MAATPKLDLMNPITKSVPDLTGEIRQAGNTISSFVDDIAKYKKEVQEKNDKQLLEVGARSYYDTDNKDLQTMSHAIYQQTMDKLIENEKKVKRNWAGVPQYNNLKYKSDNQEILQDALKNVSYLRTIDDYWKEAQKENAKNPNANDINSGAAIYNWFIDKNKTKEGKWSLTKLPTEMQGGFDINGNYIPTKVDNPNYGNVPVMNPKENTWPKTIGSTQQGTAGMGGVIAENKPDDNKTIPNPESNKILWHPGMGGTNPFLIPKPVTNWEKEIKGYVTNDGEEQIKGETKKVGDVDVTVNKTVKSNYKPETAALGIWKSLNDKSVPQQSVTVKHTLNQLDKEPEKLTQYETDYSNIFSKPETELNPFESEIRKAGNSEPTRNKYLVARANADSAITTREINKHEEKPHKYPKEPKDPEDNKILTDLITTKLEGSTKAYNSYVVRNTTTNVGDALTLDGKPINLNGKKANVIQLLPNGLAKVSTGEKQYEKVGNDFVIHAGTNVVPKVNDKKIIKDNNTGNEITELELQNILHQQSNPNEYLNKVNLLDDKGKVLGTPLKINLQAGGEGEYFVPAITVFSSDELDKHKVDLSKWKDMGTTYQDMVKDNNEVKPKVEKSGNNENFNTYLKNTNGKKLSNGKYELIIKGKKYTATEQEIIDASNK